MWPWGHLGFGYLVLSAYDHLVGGRRPGDLEALALAIGTQFPDLIDKPLGWSLEVLPSGRSLGHSLITAAIAIYAVSRVARTYETDGVGGGFAVGYLSHLVGDSYGAVLAGESGTLSYLLWPVLPIPTRVSGREYGILAHFTEIQFSPLLLLELGLGAFAVLIWILDGAPGVRPVWRALRGDSVSA